MWNNIVLFILTRQSIRWIESLWASWWIRIKRIIWCAILMAIEIQLKAMQEGETNILVWPQCGIGFRVQQSWIKKIELRFFGMASTFIGFHEMGTNSTLLPFSLDSFRVHPLLQLKNFGNWLENRTYHAEALDQIGSCITNQEGYDWFYYGKGITYPARARINREFFWDRRVSRVTAGKRKRNVELSFTESESIHRQPFFPTSKPTKCEWSWISGWDSIGIATRELLLMWISLHFWEQGMNHARSFHWQD